MGGGARSRCLGRGAGARTRARSRFGVRGAAGAKSRRRIRHRPSSELLWFCELLSNRWRQGASARLADPAWLPSPRRRRQAGGVQASRFAAALATAAEAAAAAAAPGERARFFAGISRPPRGVSSWFFLDSGHATPVSFSVLGYLGYYLGGPNLPVRYSDQAKNSFG